MLVMLGLLVGTVAMDQESDFPDVPENHWAYGYGLPSPPVLLGTMGVRPQKSILFEVRAAPGDPWALVEDLTLSPVPVRKDGRVRFDFPKRGSY